MVDAPARRRTVAASTATRRCSPTQPILRAMSTTTQWTPWSTNLGGTDFDPNHPDLDELNSALAGVLDPAVRAAYHSPKLSDLLCAVQGRQAGVELLEVVRGAQLDLPAEVEASTAARWCSGSRGSCPHRRRRDQADGRGLPPSRARTGGDGPGRHARGVDRRGQPRGHDATGSRAPGNHATAGARPQVSQPIAAHQAGQRLRNDPVALWWHIAAKLPLPKPGSSELQAGLAALALIAAGRQVTAVETRALIARLLSDLGWRMSTGEAITE
jgi:hypothetical protein